MIMEPLRGGNLVNVPEEVAKLLPGNPVESALDFLWNMPEVNVVLSGMSETEQVVQNLQYAEKAHAGMLTEQQVADAIAAGDIMRQHMLTPCTGCNYCNVCPQGIAIPEIFALHNDRHITGDHVKATKTYRALGDRDGGKCINCGACMEQCPQHIEIPKKIADIHSWYV